MTATDRRWAELQARNLNLPLDGGAAQALAQRKADARLQPSKPQQPCDIGLFSDEAAQIDLIEMLQDPVED